MGEGGEGNLGGGNKNLVDGYTGVGDFSRPGEVIRFLKGIVQQPTQVNIPNLLNSWQTTAVFIEKLFKKAYLVNKNIHLH